MGAIAEALVAYMQPLIDQTDGSQEQLDKAVAIGQLCYNLALLPEDSRDQSIGELRSSLDMTDEEFADYRHSVIDPMVRRHHEMFPMFHGRTAGNSWLSRFWGNSSDAEEDAIPRTVPARRRGDIDRYGPCPCNSGKKYKFCCGKKRY